MQGRPRGSVLRLSERILRLVNARERVFRLRGEMFDPRYIDSESG
jgi:hypothetical protein